MIIKITNKLYYFSLLLIMAACENKEVNVSEPSGYEFVDLPLEGIETHFQKIYLDQMEYFILERDRNNPHEGFGFMALKGNILVNKQDSILAYLKVHAEVQAEILALLKKTSPEIQQDYINQKMTKKLEETKFINP